MSRHVIVMAAVCIAAEICALPAVLLPEEANCSIPAAPPRFEFSVRADSGAFGAWCPRDPPVGGLLQDGIVVHVAVPTIEAIPHYHCDFIVLTPRDWPESYRTINSPDNAATYPEIYGTWCPLIVQADYWWTYRYIGSVGGGPYPGGGCALTDGHIQGFSNAEGNTTRPAGTPAMYISEHVVFPCVPAGAYEVRLYHMLGHQRWDAPAWRQNFTVTATAHRPTSTPSTSTPTGHPTTAAPTAAPATADGTSFNDDPDSSDSPTFLIVIIVAVLVLLLCVLLGFRGKSNGAKDNELDQWAERQRASPVNIPNPVYKTHGQTARAPGFADNVSATVATGNASDEPPPPLVHYDDANPAAPGLVECATADAEMQTGGQSGPGAGVYTAPGGLGPVMAAAPGTYGSLGPTYAAATPPGSSTYDSLDRGPATVYATATMSAGVSASGDAAQYSFSHVSGAAPVYATAPATSPTTDYYAVAPGAGAGDKANGNYQLLQAQASFSQPLSVTMTSSGTSPLCVHQLDRGGAEAALTAAAAADVAVVRYLLRPKGAQHVLSIYVPSTSKFYHERVTVEPVGRFTVQGCASGSLGGVAGKVAEAMAKNTGATGSEPVLRGIVNRGAAETTMA